MWTFYNFTHHQVYWCVDCGANWAFWLYLCSLYLMPTLQQRPFQVLVCYITGELLHVYNWSKHLATITIHAVPAEKFQGTLVYYEQDA